MLVVGATLHPTGSSGQQTSTNEVATQLPADWSAPSDPQEAAAATTLDQQPIQATTSADQASYRPALLGYRCESGCSSTSLAGISVIEANSPAKLTLFGEAFSRETIIAFTSQQSPSSRQQTVAGASGNATSNNSGHDCTDFNRITSLSLASADILSPNVASITVTLPETDSKFGTYFYFCLKQPKLLTSFASAHRKHLLQFNESDLVWLHQGNAWWLAIKVEPPILSIANDCLLIVGLLFLSAVTSGLNLGLMSLDMNELAVISSCGDQRERSYARTIAPLRKRGNYLLCSLLLGNVMVNSTLTVVIEEMTSGFVAIIAATLAIVVLGEIVPQAMCARQGLAIGAKTIYLTYLFMIITFPLSYPISRLLDHFLGEEKGNVYDRERLMEFIKITGHHTQLEADEVAIISGALKLKKIKVDQIMTRIEDVFMLPIDCKLDRETIKRIIEKGYSRIPIYEFADRKQIVALILAKDLALLDPDDHTPVSSMLMYCKHPLIFIEDNVTLDVALNEFKTGKSHMAVVRQIYDDGEIDKYYEAIGVVTLEDVIEEVLQTEINDETDTLSDNRRKRRRNDAQLAHLIDEFTTGNLSGLLPPPPPPAQDSSMAQQVAAGGHQKGAQTLDVSLLSSANSSSGLAVARQHQQNLMIQQPQSGAKRQHLSTSTPTPQQAGASAELQEQQFWSLGSLNKSANSGLLEPANAPRDQHQVEIVDGAVTGGSVSLLERLSHLLANVFN